MPFHALRAPAKMDTTSLPCFAQIAFVAFSFVALFICAGLAIAFVLAGSEKMKRDLFREARYCGMIGLMFLLMATVVANGIRNALQWISFTC
jgi:hypothetical protein